MMFFSTRTANISHSNLRKTENRREKLCWDNQYFQSKSITQISLIIIKTIKELMQLKQSSNQPTNFLLNGQRPEKTGQEMYDFEGVRKLQYGEVWGPESHIRRRKQILQKHPEIAELLIPKKPYTVLLAWAVIIFALSVNYMVKDASWPVFLGTLYVVGGTVNHTLHVLIHEFTHWSGHSSLLVNKVMAVLCNIPMGFPSALSFGKYHADHHNHMGDKNKDPDLPVDKESMLSKSVFYKFLFVLGISVVFVLRPMIFMKKPIKLDEIINVVVVVCTNAIIYKFWGSGALLYLLLGAYLSIGPHPASLHVIAEHYEFVKGQETFDYFGFWNFFNLNLGYHIEHHDFPSCPWYNLPKIRQAAPEFYENLPHHTSYARVVWKFLFDYNFTLYHRTIRVDKKL